jgi:hypothetical protein
MTEWTFRLTVCGIELTDEQLDTLHEAGCDDGSFSVEPDGTVLGFFDREASTEQDAVISAIVDIEHAGIDARVIRVQADDDWLTATEIAARGSAAVAKALLCWHVASVAPETFQHPPPAGVPPIHSGGGPRPKRGSSAMNLKPCPDSHLGLALQDSSQPHRHGVGRGVCPGRAHSGHRQR